MNLSFLEYIPFIKFRDENLTDEQYRNLQNELLKDPEKGDVIQGTGGLRKIRVATTGQGKRGGARAIYYYFINRSQIHFIAGYKKNAQNDLSNEQRENIKKLIETIKTENL